MDNGSILANKVREYLDICEKIDALENSLAEKEKAVAEKYKGEYSKLKLELGGYIMKIRQTVETVCSLYKNKIQMSKGMLYCANGGAAVLNYNCFNAYETSIKAGNEGIKILSAIIAKNNVDVNLREFAVRYNTIVDINSKIDRLQSQSVTLSVSQYKEELKELKNKKSSICKNDEEYKSLVSKITGNGKALSDKAVINGKLNLASSFDSELTIPLGIENCNGAVFGNNGNVPLSLLNWNLKDDGIALIRANGENASSTEMAKISVNTVLHFLFAYPSNCKRVLICDSCSTAEITTFAGSLRDGCAALFFDGASGNCVKNSEEEIRSSISELNRIINERIMLLGQSSYSDVLEYNKNNQDNPQPIILASLNGYPTKYENACDDIASALKNGRRAGVFFLISENTDDDEDSRYYRKRLPKTDTLTKTVMEFKKEGDKGVLIKNGKTYSSDLRGNDYNVGSVLSVFKSSVKSSEGKIVYLDSVVGNEDFSSSKRRQEFSKTLSIPIGKQGAVPINIDLSAKNAPHLAVIGTTGSGKTAFINSLILSAGKLYSPDELELHLIVMVKGDFKVFEECKLPHLKTVVTGDRLFAATDVLDFIDEEMKRRGELIGSLGNIYAYNEVATKKLPRCVIIIDEFLQLVAGSDDAVKRIEAIAQVGRAYGISLVISSTSFPMEVNSIMHLFEHKIEFKSGKNAGQLIPEASSRQSELEGTSGLCFYSCKGNLYSVRVAYSEEADRLKEHITSVKNKFPQFDMELQSEIKAFYVKAESDVPFMVKRARGDYEEGIIRTRLGRTYLSNKNLEYPFDSKNNLLFLFGHYLETKSVEASLIKDVLVLSKDIDEPTVYYIDMNKNTTLKRKQTIIKDLRDKWVLSGKMVYSGSDEAEDTLDEIKEMIDTREEDEDSELYPVLVVIVKAEGIFEDDDMCENLCELMNRGKENNIYFAIQCTEPVRFYGSDKIMNDAIIFPDRYTEGENYSSSSLCEALDIMPAGSTDKGKKLIANATASALHPKLHILCNNNKLSIFVPYEYDSEYLNGIV